MKKRSLLILATCLVLCLTCSGFSQAQTSTQVPTQTKTHRIVFAVSSGDEADWNISLGNIRNLIAGLKPDTTEVEVVAFAQGITLVTLDSKVADQIAALQAQNVHFVACHNSMHARHLEQKDLLAGVTPVPSGIVEIVTKQEQGWAYIKGGR